MILGAQWREEEEAIKAHFQALAHDIRAKHLKDHPNYSYQPRKPSEKKRRMTPRKAAAIAGASGTSTPATPTDIGSPAAVDPVVPPNEPTQLERTPAGNVVVNIGSEGENFEQMLLEYDENIVGPASSFNVPTLFAEYDEASRRETAGLEAAIGWEAVREHNLEATLNVLDGYNDIGHGYVPSVATSTLQYDIDNYESDSVELGRAWTLFDDFLPNH